MAKPSKMLQGMAVGMVVETTVCNVTAYGARCSCGWRCHKKPHDKIEVAERCLGRHKCAKGEGDGS